MGAITPAFLNVSGTVVVAPQSTFLPAAQLTVLVGTTQTIPANLLRKRITIMNLPLNANVDPVYLATVITSGMALVPGVWIDLYDTAAIPLTVGALASAPVVVGYTEYT